MGERGAGSPPAAHDAGTGQSRPPSERKTPESVSAEPGARSPGPGLSDEPPPFGGHWATLYAIVLGTLVILILLFYSFTKAFE